MKNLTAAIMIELRGIELVNTYAGLVEAKVYSHDFGDMYILDEIYGATTEELLKSGSTQLSLIKIGKKYHLADRAKKIYSETPCSDKNYISYIAEDVMEVSNLSPTFIEVNGKYFAGYKSDKIAYLHLPVDEKLAELISPELDSIKEVRAYTSIHGLVDANNKILISRDYKYKLRYMLGYDGKELQLLVMEYGKSKASNITNAIKQGGDDIFGFITEINSRGAWTIDGLYETLSH